MKISFKFKSPLFDEPRVKARLSAVVKAGALELEQDIKTNMQSSTPSGRTYRRGAITRKESKNTKALGLKTFVTKAGNTRAIVAYKFHRASAPGQPPAKDTGGLFGSISSRDLSETRSRVSVGKEYGAALDGGSLIGGRNKATKIVGPMRNITIAPRPFFQVRVEKFRPIFLERAAAALKG